MWRFSALLGVAIFWIPVWLVGNLLGLSATRQEVSTLEATLKESEEQLIRAKQKYLDTTIEAMHGWAMGNRSEPAPYGGNEELREVVSKLELVVQSTSRDLQYKLEDSKANEKLATVIQAAISFVIIPFFVVLFNPYSSPAIRETAASFVGTIISFWLSVLYQ